MAESSEFKVALVVGGARSGTTLLRALLDAHPEIGCPAEAGVPALLAHMARVWLTIFADAIPEVPVVDPGAADDARPNFGSVLPSPPGAGPADDGAVVRLSELPDAALSWIRESAASVMNGYLESRGKRVYVDKSLDSGSYLHVARQVFPEVKCILVFRHVMDTIASGLEASPWGFQAYGYQPYVQMTPGNFVAALAKYWLDHVAEQLEWEKQFPDSCMRVRYEDLVAESAQVLTDLQRFLGVRTDLAVVDRAFRTDLAPGPGDYKIEYTDNIHAASVGHGKRVPMDLLPPLLLESVNSSLITLGYPMLDHSWNSQERGICSSLDTVWSRRLVELMGQAPILDAATQEFSFAVVAEDHPALRWVVDLATLCMREGDGEVDAVVTGTAEDLVLMVTGQENLGVLLRSGRIRHVIADASGATVTDTRRELRLISESLRPRDFAVTKV